MINYYNIEADLKKYPDAWCYLIVGGRGTGKTYSILKYVKDKKIDFIFLKRTIEDVDTMCSGYGKATSKNDNQLVYDLNPFAAINRDTGSNITAASIKKGIGGFWEIQKEGGLKGKPIGMIFALNGVTKYKGFDLASANQDQYIIFDEFIPNMYDRISRTEGLQVLDFYKTVSRDRVHRGLNEIKLIGLANATMINNPLFDTLEIMDEIGYMQTQDMSELYIEDRGIYIHLIDTDADFLETEKKTGIYRAMEHTAWGAMSYGNDFAYNDFTMIDKVKLKNYTPVCSFLYKTDIIYAYKKDGMYYLTHSRHNNGKIYNLNREAEREKAYYDIIIDIKDATIEDKARYETYSMYDLIMNYRQIFKMR